MGLVIAQPVVVHKDAPIHIVRRLHSRVLLSCVLNLLVAELPRRMSCIRHHIEAQRRVSEINDIRLDILKHYAMRDEVLSQSWFMIESWQHK
jgi:hypothetical protein